MSSFVQREKTKTKTNQQKKVQYSTNLENLEDMHVFLDIHNLLNLNPDEVNNSNVTTAFNEIKTII